MLKRLTIALAGLFVLATSAFGAGTLPGFSLTRQIGIDGKPLAGCKLYIIQAGTTSAPQIAYQDSALTLPVSGGSQLTCDMFGFIGQFFLADGSIKVRLEDKNGVTQFTADGLLVVGASSGGGAAPSVDPTTILATGDIKAAYGNSVISGWVRFNGRTIGSATSGATERANADTQALFQYLWGADPNLAVSGGRGASASADWAANKTIALPDASGRVLANADPSGIALDTFSIPAGANTLGAKGGNQARVLTTANLPPYTPSGSVSVTSTRSDITFSPGTTDNYGSVAGTCCFTGQTRGAVTSTGSLSGNAQGGTSAPFISLQPTIIVTYYIKL